jgi:hypothetical protein
MLVPDIVCSPVSLSLLALTMRDPGAKMATQEPMLEKEDRPSELVVAPTVMALGAEAGLIVHASAWLLFPADTTTVIPACTSTKKHHITQLATAETIFAPTQQCQLLSYTYADATISMPS